MGIDLWLALGFAVLGLSVILMGAFKKAKHESTQMYSGAQDTMPEFQMFRHKTAAEPTNADHWLQWGHALVRSARRGASNNLQLLRYNEACTCYRQATEINQNYVEAWVSWGATLYELFRLQKGTDIFTMEGGHNKMQAAIDIVPDSAKLWAIWAAELKSVAKILPLENRKVVQELASNCLAKAKVIDPAVREYPEGTILERVLAGELAEGRATKMMRGAKLGDFGDDIDQELENSLNSLVDAEPQNPAPPVVPGSEPKQ